MYSCPQHSYRFAHCDDCTAMNGPQPQRYELTGLQRTYLETVRNRMTHEDRPDPNDMAADLDPDGMIRFRPKTLSDHLDEAVARWIFTEATEKWRRGAA